MLFDNMSLLDKNVVGSKYLGAKKFQHRDPLDQGLVTDFWANYHNGVFEEHLSVDLVLCSSLDFPLTALI